jgi:hypothetical protein
MTMEIALLYRQPRMLQGTARRWCWWWWRRRRKREEDLAGGILRALVLNASELVFDQPSGARGEVRTSEVVVHARMGY